MNQEDLKRIAEFMGWRRTRRMDGLVLMDGEGVNDPIVMKWDDFRPHKDLNQVALIEERLRRTLNKLGMNAYEDYIGRRCDMQAVMSNHKCGGADACRLCPIHWQTAEERVRAILEVI
jgi:hypothetical protein